ncbi:MAG: M48 family metalloprotease [Candidatus Obscuribacterales bacterium]|nr:M48 family metalloprotease [Candidatus Obscuribacterales bacterium]
MAQRVIPHDDPKYPNIHQRLLVTWLKTIVGYGLMGALIFAALWFFGFSYKIKIGFSTLYMLLPIVSWWFSAKISLYLTKSKPADPNNPRHQRVQKIIDRLFPKSGLAVQPPFYVSADPRANAFATGPIHSRAVIAMTEGLLDCDLTDDEIEAIFAHELGHVKNYDVGINSMIAIMSSFLFAIVDSGLRILLASAGLFKKVVGIRPEQSILPAFLTNIIMYVVFWLLNKVSRLIQLFVVRSRESGADATGSFMTGHPCQLASALLKLVAHAQKNRPKGRDAEMFRVLRPMMTVDVIFDSVHAEPEPNGLWEKIVRWWKSLQLTHPPVPERVYYLERMNGGKCDLPKV